MDSDKAFKGEPIQPPAPSKKGAPSRGWRRLKAALTWSLRSGSFLDSQFYALDSKPQTGTPTIRPIYFCSEVGGAFLPKFEKCKFSTKDCGNVINTSARFVKNWSIHQDPLPSVCR